MARQTLLGHLAAQFIPESENLATESIHYILSESPVARFAFLRLMSQFGSEFKEDLSFQTQTGEDESARPDMVGKDASGSPVLIVEAKFWAPLTDKQPLAYLATLPMDRPSVLVFLAPEKRFDTLWPELMRRAANVMVGSTQPAPNGGRVIQIGNHSRMALVSWRATLNVLLHAVESAMESETANDIRQLQGLCDYMDETAFLPLRSEDLTSTLGTRIEQYCQLIDDVTSQLAHDGIARLRGLHATGVRSTYIRYMRIHGFGCAISFSPRLWSTRFPTPLWLSFWDWGGPGDKHWKYSRIAHERLAELERENPPRLFRDDEALRIPLHLELGAEKHKVVDALLSQIREVAVRLQEAPSEEVSP